MVPSKNSPSNPNLVKYQVLDLTLDQDTKVVSLKEAIFIDENGSTVATQQANDTFVLDSKKYQTLRNAIHGVMGILEEAKSNQPASSPSQAEGGTIPSSNVHPPGQEKPKSLPRIRITAEQLMREYQFGGYIDSDPDPHFKGKELIVTGTISVIKNLSHPDSFLGMDIGSYVKVLGLQTSSPTGGFVGFSFDDQQARDTSEVLHIMGFKPPHYH